MDDILASLREYAVALFTTGLFVFAWAIGLLGDLKETWKVGERQFKVPPRWLRIGLAVLLLVVPPFLIFHRQRMELVAFRDAPHAYLKIKHAKLSEDDGHTIDIVTSQHEGRPVIGVHMRLSFENKSSTDAIRVLHSIMSVEPTAIGTFDDGKLSDPNEFGMERPDTFILAPSDEETVSYTIRLDAPQSCSSEALGRFVDSVRSGGEPLRMRIAVQYETRGRCFEAWHRYRVHGKGVAGEHGAAWARPIGNDPGTREMPCDSITPSISGTPAAQPRPVE